MKISRKPLVSSIQVALLTIAAAGGNLYSSDAAAITVNRDIYVPLDQPCRLLDTRVAVSVGRLSSTNPLLNGNYIFGTTQAAISSDYQSGNPAGCDIPVDATAIGAAINQINPSASGDIRVWSADANPVGPSAGSAVYNPGLLYNGAFSNIALSSTGKFFLHVDNGDLDLTINVTGYWEPIGTLPAGATGATGATGGAGSTGCGPVGSGPTGLDRLVLAPRAQTALRAPRVRPAVSALPGRLASLVTPCLAA